MIQFLISQSWGFFIFDYMFKKDLVQNFQLFPAMKNMIVVISLLIPFYLVAQGIGEPIVFNLIHKGDVIGTLTAEKIEEKGKQIYKVSTDVRKKVLHIKTCLYTVDATYANGFLTHSDFKFFINDKLDKYAVIEENEGQLYGSKQGKKKKKINKPVPYSTAKFYFEEPSGVSKIFSETKLKERDIAPHATKAHTYVLEKNKGEYIYENGELQKIIYEEGVKVELVRQ